MPSITITVPHPPKECRPNGRFHYMAKARANKKCRIRACLLATAEMNGQPPRWKKAAVQVVAYFRTAAFPDPDNFIASLKATFDGIADAGVVENDRGLWPERPQFFKDRDDPRVELTITQEE